MAVLFKRFSSILEAEDFVNDRIIGTVSVAPFVGVNVRNKTLVFTTPAKTITFPNTAAFERAQMNQIIDEINDQAGVQIAAIRSYGHGIGGKDFRVALIRDSDVTTGGTAAAALGLPTSITTVGANKIIASDIVDSFSHDRAVVVVYDA
jgi:hypothetical protein